MAAARALSGARRRDLSALRRAAVCASRRTCSRFSSLDKAEIANKETHAFWRQRARLFDVVGRGVLYAAGLAVDDDDDWLTVRSRQVPVLWSSYSPRSRAGRVSAGEEAGPRAQHERCEHRCYQPLRETDSNRAKSRLTFQVKKHRNQHESASRFPNAVGLA